MQTGRGGEGASFYIVYSAGDTGGGGVCRQTCRQSITPLFLYSQIQSVLGGIIYNKLLHWCSYVQ